MSVLRHRLARIGLLAVAFAALPPILSRVLPGLLTEPRAQIIGRSVCFAAAALSLNVLMGYAGQMSLGHSALIGVGAFTSGLLTDRYFEGPMLAGVVAAVVVGSLIALLLGLPALRLRGLYLAIVTIGFALMMEQSFFSWEPISGGSAGLPVPRPWIGSYYFLRNGDYLAIVLLLFLVIWLIDVNVVRTKLGRAFRAIRESEDVAQSFGIDVARYKLGAFVLSGALAGVAGAMYAHNQGFINSDSFTYRDSLALVVAVVVGGLGSRTGVVIAALAFSVLPRLFSFLEGWDLLVAPILLIDLLARHPGGFAEALREGRERRLARGRTETGEDDPVVAIPRMPQLPEPEGTPPSPVTAGDPLLEVSGVSVRFGGLQALDGVSVTVPKRGIVGLIGPNGAGKSTLFNSVSGYVRPDAGTVSFRGEAIQHLPPHARARLGIGRTFQLIGLVKSLSVRENFLLAQHQLAVYGSIGALTYAPWASFDEAEIGARADASIEALGFQRYADTPVGRLSHGQQRLVEIGCSLATSPEILLLDEPSAGMAPGAVENLAVRLGEIRSDLDRTVLLIEHNIPLVLEVCDYIYVLNFGQILAEGTTDEIARRPDVIAAYFGESAEAAAAAAPPGTAPAPRRRARAKAAPR